MEPTADVSLFRLPADEVIELPEKQSGQTVYVKVRALNTDELVAATQGIPVAAGGDPAADFEANVRTMTRVARAGIVAPEFSFDGPVDGKADWGAVSLLNRSAIVSAISRLSGARPATALEQFRDEGAGNAAGSDPGADGESPAVGEPGPAPAA